MAGRAASLSGLMTKAASSMGKPELACHALQAGAATSARSKSSCCCAITSKAFYTDTRELRSRALGSARARMQSSAAGRRPLLDAHRFNAARVACCRSATELTGAGRVGSQADCACFSAVGGDGCFATEGRQANSWCPMRRVIPFSYNIGSSGRKLLPLFASVAGGGGGALRCRRREGLVDDLQRVAGCLDDGLQRAIPSSFYGRSLRRGLSCGCGGEGLFHRGGMCHTDRTCPSGLAGIRCVATTPQPVVPGEGVSLAETGFELVSEQLLEEYKASAVLYRHKKTGAEVMSVSNDDENKVFGIVFRTPPTDSTGIPHILEHSVLCGSHKYPIKEPFVELMKGSLQTFLNAFTYPDRTCYPVASTNLQDFYNLVDVYLDAVFYPRCISDEQTFQQEGWHYEIEDPNDDLTFKGVVFNEMKGVYSQPDSILARKSQQALFPDNTYGVDSGGDPAVIPSLTFKQFQEFHRKFYHPSNARIWFYGDDDPKKRLLILNEYLSNFDANSSVQESEVGIQPLFAEPMKVVEKYPVGAESGDIKKKHMVSLNWVLSDQDLHLQTELALGFLDHLLLGTPGAPLRKALLESALGEALVGGGLEDELRQPQFSVGLKGVAEQDVGRVEELIFGTIKKLIDEGFDPEAIEASINTIEFSLRENNTGSFPRGLSLMLRSMRKWLYGKDPFEPLRFEKPLEAFKARLAAEGAKAVFSPLLQKYLLDNPHRVTILLEPDVELASKEEEREKQTLREAKSVLTEEDISKLIEETKSLKERQETPDPPEALAVVPSLKLSDIPKQSTKIPIVVSDQADGSKVLRHNLFTNNVLYAEVGFDMRSLSTDLLPLVPLFCQSLLEMGTKDMDFVKLNQLIGRMTGGISVYPLTSAARGKSEPISYCMVRGKAMARQSGHLFELMRKILTEVQFDDQQRFKQFVMQAKARMESRIIGSGHSIAAARLDAKLNSAGWVSEQMGGLSFYRFLKDLEARVKSDWPSVVASLEQIRHSLLKKDGTIINLTADDSVLMQADRHVTSFLDAMPAKDLVKLDWSSVLPLRNEGLVIPTQVNYVGKAADLYKAGYQLHGSAYVISKFLGTTWLWDRVRVSGGAYGGFCDFDSHSGAFTYLSYRDPNLLKTLENYDGTVDFLHSLELDEDSLTKAIIGTIGDVDAYQLPDAKGYTSMIRYLLGVSDEERQQRREEILSTSISDFRAFANVLGAVRDHGLVVTVASQEDVTAALAQQPGLLEPQNVL